VLASEVAADYFGLRELDTEIQVIRRSIEAQRQALGYVSSRHDLGVASGLDLAQQQAQLDTTTTQVDILANQRAQMQHALATLTGTPAPGFVITPAERVVAVPFIPVGIPSDILERRPDVASAERAMAAANAQIGVARAAYFPSVQLTPLIGNSLGLESNNIATLLSAPSLMWAIGLTSALTLIDAGQRDATTRFAEQGYQITLAKYRQTVLTAMQEVEDGITGVATLGRASHEADAAVDSAQRVLDLANDRYAGGLANYLDVITAQQALLTNQRQAAQIRGQQLLAAVHLVKALGGGWNAEPNATANAVPTG